MKFVESMLFSISQLDKIKNSSKLQFNPHAQSVRMRPEICQYDNFKTWSYHNGVIP